MTDEVALLQAQTVELVEAARKVFAGKPAPAVGAALADLLAIWLASHIEGEAVDGPESARLRKRLLERHVKTVRRLVPPNVGIIKDMVWRRAAH